MKTFKLIFTFLLTAILMMISSFVPVQAIYDVNPEQNNIFGMGIVNLSDIDDVQKLVNSNGGSWGYVKVVITIDQRNKDIWQSFFDEARRKKLIPIVRVADSFDGKNWQKPKLEDIDSWVAFFNSLNWVTENRYIIIGNEPNHSKEWGGSIEPEEYAFYLKTFSEKLKNSGSDYFVLNAGFDQDAPNSKKTMDQKVFMQRMLKEIPDLFNYIDGWNSHSYPNPAFSGNEKANGRRTIRGYEWELELIKSFGINKDLPIFITETGWVHKANNESLVAEKMKYAFNEIWSKDDRIVAVTPFILNYTQEPFKDFSWKKDEGNYRQVYQTILDLPKKEGKPKQKISGDIVFNFLNPFIISSANTPGAAVVRNTGQAIWEESDIKIKNNSESNIEVVDIKETTIEPNHMGLVLYKLKSKEDTGMVNNVKLGFFIKENKIGNIFEGKIISF